MLEEDIHYACEGKDPDNVIEADAMKGRDAVNNVMEVYQNLVKSGDVVNLL